MKYTQEELDQKIWYRFLKVIFWVLFTIAIVISFLFAKIEATTKVVDYDKTYETTGERVRNMYGNTTQWTEGNYGSLSNSEIGQRIYEAQYRSDVAAEMWKQTMNGIEMYKDKYSLWEKVGIFTKAFGLVLMIFGLVQVLSRYILTGRSPLYS